MLSSPQSSSFPQVDYTKKTYLGPMTRSWARQIHQEVNALIDDDITTSVSLRWDSKCRVLQQEKFSHMGDLGFISNSQGTKAKLLPILSSNLQSSVFVLCPQLHRVVVKHKASVLVK
jgi:hypothetical protein